MQKKLIKYRKRNIQNKINLKENLNLCKIISKRQKIKTINNIQKIKRVYYFFIYYLCIKVLS